MSYMMIETKPFEFAPYSYIKIDNGLVYARTVIYPNIIDFGWKKGVITNETMTIDKKDFQRYRKPVWNKEEALTVYTCKEPGSSAALEIYDSGVIKECSGVSIGSLVKWMDNWISKEKKRFPSCRNVHELLGDCLILQREDKVPYQSMALHVQEQKLFVKIPPFIQGKKTPDIETVSIELRRWLKGLANKDVNLLYTREEKGLTFVYMMD
jgi:hypothetical protein